MKTPRTTLCTLIALGAASGLLACSAGDSPEAITQAEAELVAEQQTAEADTDGETPSKKGKKGRRGHRHHHGPKDPAKMIAHFDENGDGVLEMSELPAHKQKWLADADADQDGQLSADELKAHFEARQAKRFAKKDKNGDGFLTEDELGEHRFKHMKAADADGDGRLTAAEIAQAFESGTLRHRGRHHGKFGRRGFFGAPNPEKFVERFDQNENGTLELDELPGKMSEKMAKADTNGDGSLSLEELEQAYESGALKHHRFGKHGKKGRHHGPERQ